MSVENAETLRVQPKATEDELISKWNNITIKSNRALVYIYSPVGFPYVLL